MIRLRRDGFTLTEMLVVVLIMAILAAIGIPMYLKTVENQKAGDAAAMINMVGTVNRMYALDHSGTYVTGAFPSASPGTCGSGACPTDASAQSDPCVLVWCRYLADQPWGDKAYQYYSCNGAATQQCSALGPSATNLALGKRKSGTYSSWGYVMGTNGVFTKLNGGEPDPSY